jgi:hypothetical protein
MVLTSVSCMPLKFKKSRSLLLIAILIFAIATCTAPVFAAAPTSILQVSSSPSNAQACLDQWYCQGTPATFLETADSYHSLTVYQAGYTQSSQTVYAPDAGETTSINVNLVSSPSQTGVLNLDSNPSNAGVWIDNVYYGTTPQTIGDLNSATHTLILKKAGYFDFTVPMSIASGETTNLIETLTPYTPASGYGDIQITTTPLGGAVYVDNNYEGITVAGVNGASSPLYVTQLSPGSYIVSITLANYQTYTTTATVTAGSVYTIQATLVPVTPGSTPITNGVITVESNPAGANIYLDNAFKGITPLTLVNVPEGTHIVLLRLTGYQDWQVSKNVPAGGSVDTSGILAPSTSPSSPTAMPTQSPVAVFTILSAIALCSAIIMLQKKNR